MQSRGQRVTRTGSGWILPDRWIISMLAGILVAGLVGCQSGMVHYRQGLDQMEASRYEGAAASFESATTWLSSPRMRALAYVNLGNSLVMSGEPARAVQAYSEAIDLDWHHTLYLDPALIYTLRARALHRSGQHRRALQDLHTAERFAASAAGIEGITGLGPEERTLTELRASLEQSILSGMPEGDRRVARAGAGTRTVGPELPPDPVERPPNRPAVAGAEHEPAAEEEEPPPAEEEEPPPAEEDPVPDAELAMEEDPPPAEDTDEMGEGPDEEEVPEAEVVETERVTVGPPPSVAPRDEIVARVTPAGGVDRMSTWTPSAPEAEQPPEEGTPPEEETAETEEVPPPPEDEEAPDEEVVETERVTVGPPPSVAPRDEIVARATPAGGVDRMSTWTPPAPEAEQPPEEEAPPEEETAGTEEVPPPPPEDEEAPDEEEAPEAEVVETERVTVGPPPSVEMRGELATAPLAPAGSVDPMSDFVPAPPEPAEEAPADGEEVVAEGEESPEDEPAETSEQPEAAALGWDGEEMPDGMSRAEEEEVYLWDAGEGVRIEMVHVPAGEFTMGSESFVADPDEQPRHQHPVEEDYYIARTEVSRGQYRAFCEATDRSMPADPPWEATDEHPITNVSWQDAVAFCEWAGLRLPSEAEWEKAARGTDGRVYPWGDRDPFRQCVWVGHPTYSGSPAPVGSLPEGISPYGALDMAGNVWEWCRTLYEETAYARYAGGDLSPASEGPGRVNRGGSYIEAPPLCRSAKRQWDPEDYADMDLGFRPAR